MPRRSDTQAKRAKNLRRLRAWREKQRLLAARAKRKHQFVPEVY